MGTLYRTFALDDFDGLPNADHFITPPRKDRAKWLDRTPGDIEVAEIRADQLNRATRHLGQHWQPCRTSYASDPVTIGRWPQVGDYLNRIGHSDRHPFVIERMTASGKTAYVRAIHAELADDWKPEFVPGGFVGHCVNNHAQRWAYGVPFGPEKAVRATSTGWRCKGTLYLPSTEPLRFHDYNF